MSAFLELDLTTKCITDIRSEKEIGLTYAEAAVLAFLLSEPNVIHSKQTLLEQGWPDCVVAASSITQCISTLRKKLEPYPELSLKTEVRRGYMLQFSEPAPIRIIDSEPEITNNSLFSALKMKTVAVVAAMLMVVAMVVWYFSDYHNVIKDSFQWRTGDPISLEVGDVRDTAELYYRGDVQQLGANMWQRHLLPSAKHHDFLNSFKAVAATDGNSYSVALCPEYQAGYCPGKDLINISAVTKEPVALDFDEFLKNRKVMEGRIAYNRLPEIEGSHYRNGVTENYYHTNIYFPTSSRVLVRADFSMSLVYESEDEGQFLSSTCLSDQGCDTTPVKYNISGTFKQYEQTIDGNKVEVLHVTLNSKELTKPEVVSEPASDFYLMLRKNAIFDKELFFYRTYQDEKTAVWLVPMYGNLAVWMTRTELVL